jgi:predicted enzyme related to lactoylglutathione lyase
MQFPEGDRGTELVLHCIESIPVEVDVNYLVDDVFTSVAHFEKNGCEVLVSPFNIPIGKCAVIRDPLKHVWSILDMTKGGRERNYEARCES